MCEQLEIKKKKNIADSVQILTDIYDNLAENRENLEILLASIYGLLNKVTATQCLERMFVTLFNVIV